MQSFIPSLTHGKAKKIYNKLLGSIENYPRPHQFIHTLYREKYLSVYPNSPSTNGRVFEYAICETLARAKILPFYYQAKFLNVPNCDFDIVLYHPQTPVALSVKVSLRERYKQADLEGMALKQVYRRAKQYLITLNHKEAIGIKAKIKNYAVNGINEVYVANDENYSELLQEIKKEKFQHAMPIMPIHGTMYGR